MPMMIPNPAFLAALDVLQALPLPAPVVEKLNLSREGFAKLTPPPSGGLTGSGGAPYNDTHNADEILDIIEHFVTAPLTDAKAGVEAANAAALAAAIAALAVPVMVEAP